MRSLLADLFAITRAELDEFFEVRDPVRHNTDTKTNDTQTIIELELPGIKKEDIKIKKSNFVDYDNLIVSGKNRRGVEFKKTYYLYESDMEHIKAEYKDGILKIIIPRITKPKPTESEVKIE